MARVVVTETASADQSALLTDLFARAGRPTAARYRSRFASCYDRLAAHPAIGPRRPALGPDIRIAIVTPYVIVYAFDESRDTVTILRVIHGRRDIAARLPTRDR